MTATDSRHRAEDEAHRRLIRELLGETLVVEAGAGTGKTRALVDRYVALVLGGRRVEELAAITFTEKAAAELRDRVRGELERLHTGGSGERILVEAALESLDRAPISTIHAFALGVLRSFAAENGIDPEFTTLDEMGDDRRFQARWHTFLDDTGRDPAAVEAFRRALALGLTPGQVEKLAEGLWRHGPAAELLHETPLTATPPPLDPEGWRQQLLDIGFDGVPESDLLRRAIEAALAKLELLVHASLDEREARLPAIALALRSSGQGTQKNWGGKERVEDARATFKQVCDEVSEALTGLRSQALAGLLPTVVRFAIEDSQARLRDGELPFDDLILRLANLLRDDPGARRRLRARYSALLIDEFQDTDPLQVRIALAFARDPETGVMESSRLFLVGDPKQSIYRFRRADMAIYSGTRETIEANGGRFLQLALNRRSRQPVIEFVNAAFAGIIGDGGSPGVQPPYRPIHPERFDLLHGPGAARAGGPLDLPAAAVRAHESGQVAAWCRTAVAQGWEVWEGRQAGAPRPARFRDIAILVPARTIVPQLERALAAAGVPFRIEGGSLIFATQEVRDLINCLTAIDDPGNDVAVVAALRSPAYACSDVELAGHRLAGGRFDYLATDLDAFTGRVAEALCDLRARHLARNGTSIAHLVERFVADTGMAEAATFDAGNRNAFRRARFVIEQARAFEASAPQGLRSFIGLLERRVGDAILDHEGAGLDDDEDAVRVLTIHGAKGLEFPIVFLAGLGSGRSNRSSVIGFDPAAGDVSISIGSSGENTVFTLGPADRHRQQEQAHGEAERDRLLYVAATRARDHLLLFLYHRGGKQPGTSSAERLASSEATRALPALEELPAPVDQSLSPFAGLEVDAPVTPETEFEASRASLVVSAAPTPVTSATALARVSGQKGEAAAESNDEREDETEPWSHGRGGTHRGRAVHAALQTLPWVADDVTIEALARAQAVAEAIPGDALAVAELLRRALATDAAARARTALRASREVPFAFVSDSVIVEGFVDLVIESPGGLELVDWKTDNISADAVASRLEAYSLQAGLYVLGIEAATGRPVNRVTYVFVTPGIESSPGDPATLAALARDRLREVTV